MITRKFRIYDTGAKFCVKMVEISPVKLSPLIPRYVLHEWHFYKNGEIYSRQTDQYSEDRYIDGEYSEYIPARQALEILNNQHYEQFKESINI